MIDLGQIKQDVENSAFLADVGEGDRRIWRLVATVSAMMGGVVAILVLIGLLGAVGVAVYLVSGGYGPDDVTAMMLRFQDPKHVLTYKETMAALLLVGVFNSLMFISAVVIAGLIAKRPFRAYVTAAARFRWRLLLAGIGLFVLVLGPVLAVGAWLDPQMPTYPMFRLTETAGQRLTYALVGILCLFPAAFAEEVLFRGWLLKQVAAFSRNIWVLLAINGVLFALFHWPDIGPSALLARTIMGGGFCYMVLRLGGLEFATGAHAANNILLLLFVQPLTIVPDPEQPFVPLMAVGALVEVTGYVLITEIAVRWKALRDWAGVDVAAGRTAVKT
jgi:uncharacterized protein